MSNSLPRESKSGCDEHGSELREATPEVEVVGPPVILEQHRRHRIQHHNLRLIDYRCAFSLFIGRLVGTLYTGFKMEKQLIWLKMETLPEKLFSEDSDVR